MILHDHPMSPYAMKVRVMLREKGIPFEARLPEGLGSGQDGTGLGEMNPRVEVPALETGNGTLFDSTIILEYLEDAFPEPPMMPASPMARARMRMIEEVCDTHYEAINWGLVELRYFGRASGELEATLRANAATEIAHLNAWLDGQLGQQEWLNGERFGWGDLAALPVVFTAELHGIAPPAGSALSAWLKRCVARPSVAATTAEALAVIPQLEALSGALTLGGFRRHYRDHRLEWMIRAGGLQVVLDGLAADNLRFTDLSRFSA